MIKILILTYECHTCGSIINFERQIVVDEWTNTIKIIKPRCSCGGNKLKLKEISIQ